MASQDEEVFTFRTRRLEVPPEEGAGAAVDDVSLRRVAEYEIPLHSGRMPTNQKFERNRLRSFANMPPHQLELLDERILAQVRTDEGS
jgi:hypothetical protein